MILFLTYLKQTLKAVLKTWCRNRSFQKFANGSPQILFNKKLSDYAQNLRKNCRAQAPWACRSLAFHFRSTICPLPVHFRSSFWASLSHDLYKTGKYRKKANVIIDLLLLTPNIIYSYLFCYILSSTCIIWGTILCTYLLHGCLHL